MDVAGDDRVDRDHFASGPKCSARCARGVTLALDAAVDRTRSNEHTGMRRLPLRVAGSRSRCPRGEPKASGEGGRSLQASVTR